MYFVPVISIKTKGGDLMVYILIGILIMFASIVDLILFVDYFVLGLIGIVAGYWILRKGKERFMVETIFKGMSGAL